MSTNYSEKLINLSKKIANQINFSVISPKERIPYGFKKHTRSISWLAEQVITQHIRFNKKKYNLEIFEESKTDISVFDFKIKFKDTNETLYVNSKITWIKQKKQRNDMSSIKKLINFFEENRKAKLFYLIFPFDYNGSNQNEIKFTNKIICGEYIKMEDFYLNPRNEHLQSFYDVPNVERSYSDFLEIIKKKQKEGKKEFIKF